jgi:acyl-CoA thioesterase-1
MFLVSALRAGAVLGGLAIAASTAATAEPLRTPCRVADEFLATGGALDRAAAHLKADDAFTVLVLGSSSTAGVGASAPDKSYTERLEAELSTRLAGVDVEVVASGVGGETAIGAEARMEGVLAKVKPDLVLWQIGTNDAARRIDVAQFRSAALEGLADIARAGVDAALLDPQYVPQDEAGYAPYLGALDAISAQLGVPVIRRYAAMRALTKAGAGDMLSRDRLHMNDAGHACVGAIAAEALGRRLAPMPAVAEATKRS